MNSYPFFYFYNLSFDSQKILEFVDSIPKEQWIGPHISNYDKTVPVEPHPADGFLWTANNNKSNFKDCDEIVRIRNNFQTQTGFNFINAGMIIKKSKNGYRSPFHPLMQNLEWDKKKGIKRTFDIIVPLQGGFKESPLEAIDTKTNEHYVLEPKGIPFMVPCDPSWHYSWMETVEDWRLTLHLRGIHPISYEDMKSRYTV